MVPRTVPKSLSNCVLVLLFAGLGACVPKSRYDLALKNAAEVERAGEEARADATELRKKLEAATQDNEQKTAKLSTYEEQTYQDSRRLAELEEQLTALANTNTEVGERLRLASKSLTELATERRTLVQAVADTRACLDALSAARLRAAQAAQAAKGAAPKPNESAPEPLELERCVQKAVAPTTPPISGTVPATAAPTSGPRT